MKILLVCAMGASTGVMVNKMKTAAESDSTIDKSNLEIRAISADNFKESYKNYDVVLLGPQIRFKEKEFGKLCSDSHIAMKIIPIADYGMMRGDNVLKLAIKMYEDNK
ncbi:PTS sugar transporter subunit IIB [Clostridium sp. BJN0001]|uniref:PTS sugar transporter subunit IIB n=1 Tax=Clostridium sp. BJN0001 TaxID=2930219 RepID=UPI001FD317BC|nr:PTS sugar transporter subunit IIB [Clostridium sp. BJN0001]